jgi:hypothetical protein
MINIALTDEQAKWLKEHLDVELLNAHYMQEGTFRGDALEHAQTVHDKIEKELKSKEW